MPAEHVMEKPGNLLKLSLYFRAFLYWCVLVITTITIGGSIVLLFWTPLKWHFALGRAWAASNLWGLKYCCGLDYEILGLESMPQEACILMAKHQSTFETMVILKHFPCVAWVLKRELLHIPVFGWALALTRPIGINRQSGSRAIDQIVTQGREALQKGRWVVIFPEGTRVAPGSSSKYKIGGGILVAKTGYPFITLAHNAGEFWSRGSAIKWPGKITFVLGSKIEAGNKKPEEIIQETQEIIETNMQTISDPARWNR